MRFPFRRTAQKIDGITDTLPNAGGGLPYLIKTAGFQDIEERAVVQTLTGSISVNSALAG